ncbi:MAG: hypothetical protein PHF60_04770 [Candidatus ainarchaeum sp.]|nr:hypothetical protein [Candidatus ainarchaeum sp.]
MQRKTFMERSEVVRKFGGPQLIRQLPMTDRLQVVSMLAIEAGKTETAKKLAIKACALVLSRDHDGAFQRMETIAAAAGLGPEDMKTAVQNGMRGYYPKIRLKIAKRWLGADEQKEEAMGVLTDSISRHEVDLAKTKRLAKSLGFKADDVIAAARRIVARKLTKDPEEAYAIAKNYLPEAEQEDVRCRMVAKCIANDMKRMKRSEYTPEQAFSFGLRNFKENGQDSPAVMKYVFQELFMVEERYRKNQLAGVLERVDGNEPFLAHMIALRYLGPEEQKAAAMGCLVANLEELDFYAAVSNMTEFQFDETHLKEAAKKAFDNRVALAKDRCKPLSPDIMDLAERYLGPEERREAAMLLVRGVLIDTQRGCIETAKEMVSRGGLKDEDVRNIASEVCDILRKRKDGYYLGEAFMVADAFLGKKEQSEIGMLLINKMVHEGAIDRATRLATSCGLDDVAEALGNVLKLRGPAKE